MFEFDDWVEPEDPLIPLKGIGIYEAYVQVFNAPRFENR
jgi:hypothetical protein